MDLFGIKKRFKRRIEKKFEPIQRTQFNILCDRKLATRVRMLAHALECPVYCVAEHLLQLGLAEVSVSLEDQALRERLCRHLVQDHLLTPVTKPESEPISRRALRVRNAMKFLDLIEIRAGSPEVVRQIIDRVLEEA